MGCQGEVSTGTRSSCSSVSSAKSLFGIVSQLTVAFQKALWVFGLNSRLRSGPSGAGHCLAGPSEDPNAVSPS